MMQASIADKLALIFCTQSVLVADADGVDFSVDAGDGTEASVAAAPEAEGAVVVGGSKATGEAVVPIRLSSLSAYSP